jgi:hypothetical protein|uniref:Uncharacterized protein n=1 Tax=uncultured prokaryote TaxID=198431 RepID=A0A0H5Q4S1_9ZZZZ|nr:hypothetical protein [uncultured prokaryote]
MSKVPDWVVGCLGSTVTLKRDFETATGVFERGYPARLVSIQSGWPDTDQPYATIALDPEDVWEENIPFDAIEPERT